MEHRWMNKNYNKHPQSFVPKREQLGSSLDSTVIKKMVNLKIGTLESIKSQLEHTISSEEYHRPARSSLYAQKWEESGTESDEATCFPFKQKKVSGHPDHRARIVDEKMPSHEIGSAIGSVDPLISLYHLAQERLEKPAWLMQIHCNVPTVMYSLDWVFTRYSETELHLAWISYLVLKSNLREIPQCIGSISWAVVVPSWLKAVLPAF